MKLDDLCADLWKIPEEHKDNLEKLLAVLNPIEDFYIDLGGDPWRVTSGYRLASDHVRIYERINAERKKEKKKPLAIPLGSQHLKGNAIDVADDKELKLFITENIELFEGAGIYFEAFTHSPSWVHMQRIPPRSLARFFLPY